MSCGVVVLVTSAVVGILLAVGMHKSVSTLSESSTCPLCYGTDLCEDIHSGRITLQYASFSDFFYNIFSVKNTYFGRYDGARVVLKKLGHGKELEEMKRKRLFEPASGAIGLRTCDEEVAESFLKAVKSRFEPEHVWTMMQINAEPLVLSILQDGGWPVPGFRGSCGLIVVEDYCGLPLNNFQNSPWKRRAFLALQLLRAAIDFTHKHPDFRLYLTDVSPDNVAVDDNFKLSFVDLENVVLKQKREDNSTPVHYSEFFDEEEFVYSEEAVCAGSVSDHNVYAICRLLLSENAPWPMMTNGLLHSPPPAVEANHKELLDLVEKCVSSHDKLSRFYVAEDLMRLLQLVINKS